MEKGGGLALVDSAAPSPIYFIAYWESGSARLDAWRFRGVSVYGDFGGVA